MQTCQQKGTLVNPKNTFDTELALKASAILAKPLPEDAMLREFSELVQIRIRNKGRGTGNWPSMAAVLEESLVVRELTARQKLDRCRDIVEIMHYFQNLMNEIPSPMPDIIKRAKASAPGMDDLLSPFRLNLN